MMKTSDLVIAPWVIKHANGKSTICRWFMMIHDDSWKSAHQGDSRSPCSRSLIVGGSILRVKSGEYDEMESVYVSHGNRDTHTHIYIYYIYIIYIYTDLACKIRVSSASTRPWEPTRQSQKLEFQQFKHENSHKFMQNWPKEWPAPTSYRSHQYCSGPTFGCPEKPLTRLITCSHAHTQLSRHIISKPRPNMAKCW